jgi:prophage regulatory protein
MAKRVVIMNTSVTQQELQPIRLIRRSTVEHMTGLSRSTIYSRIKEGTFPSQIKLGGTAVAWRESDVQTWIQDCLDASNRHHN